MFFLDLRDHVIFHVVKSWNDNALQFLRQIVHKLIATLEFEYKIFEPALLRV